MKKKQRDLRNKDNNKEHMKDKNNTVSQESLNMLMSKWNRR